MNQAPAEQQFTRTISVPGWMVQVAIWFIGVLGLGAVATLVSIVNWAFVLQRDVGGIKADQAAARVKEADLVSSMNSLGKDVREGFNEQNRAVGQLQRDVDVLKSKMP